MVSSFEEILISGKVLTPEKLTHAQEFAASNSCSLRDALVRTKACTPQQVGIAVAKSYGLKFVDFGKAKVQPSAVALIPADMAFEKKAMPIVIKDGILYLAMSDFDIETIDTLRFLLEGKVRDIIVVIGIPEEIERMVEEHYRKAQLADAAKGTGGEGVGVRKDGETGDDVSADDAPIIKYVNDLIANAVTVRASDIHVEPYENKVRIRYRIDGVCQDQSEVPKRLQGPIISRIKIISGMDMAEKRKPQSGRILANVHGRQIDLRVSCEPAYHGECIVMRILDKEKALVDLEELGFHETDLGRFEQIIKRPNGIFLVTGPTGSGKTTTLYAALKKLNTPDVKIVTAENPVEYKIEGINQTQVKPEIELTFARILRFMMRQAPNIILIGEIRDRETADIAIQAALTGHLVFSTLHTNDAPSAITRLIDIGITPYLVSATVMAVMGQRLVRILCPTCKKAYEPTDDELKSIGLVRSQIEGTSLYEEGGCKNCNKTGYKGRKGIFELMEMSDEIRNLTGAKASVDKIRTVAESEGMVTLQQDAVRKVVAGLTTIREILRVTHSLE